MQTCQGTVDRSRYLRMRPCEIADELVIGDGELNAHWEWAIADAIVIDPVLGLVDPLGELCQFKACHTFAVVKQRFDRVLNYIKPVFMTQFLETPLAQAQGGCLGIHITQGHVRQAYVSCYQVDQALDGSLFIIELDAG